MVVVPEALRALGETPNRESNWATMEFERQQLEDRGIWERPGECRGITAGDAER